MIIISIVIPYIQYIKSSFKQSICRKIAKTKQDLLQKTKMRQILV